MEFPCAKRMESHETSQKRFEENTSKKLLIDNTCPPRIPQCPPPPPFKPCNTIPDPCCSENVVSVVCPPAPPLCFPSIKYPAPTVSVQWKPPTVEMQCWPVNACPTVASSACCGTLQDVNSGGNLSQYTFTECTDWESNLVSHTDKKGNSKLLVSEDSEKSYRKVTCKDLNGISDAYYKGSERKSTTVCCEKGKDGRKPCKDCLKKCVSPCETEPDVRYMTKVKFNNR